MKKKGGSPKIVKLVFDIALPGLNGKDGLIRSHFTKRKALKEKIKWMIVEQGFERVEGKVRVTYKRVSNRLMDWDNLASSSKILMDCLVDYGIIKDDSPKFIPECPLYLQEKGKPFTEVLIEGFSEGSL